MTAETRTNREVIWFKRHFIVLLLSMAGVYGFLELRAQWSEMHRWNRAVGDASLILVAISMSIGPMVRLFPFTRPALVWRREFGIYGVVLISIHAAIILVGWVQWDLVRLFGFELHPSGDYVMFQKGFGIGNTLGIIALFYGLTLALTSNDWSQRLLGGPTWKFLQQSSYILWMLIVVHTAYFLYFHFLSYHRSTPAPNILQIPFAVLVASVLSLQTAAFFKTWRLRKSPSQPAVQGKNT